MGLGRKSVQWSIIGFPFDLSIDIWNFTNYTLVYCFVPSLHTQFRFLPQNLDISCQYQLCYALQLLPPLTHGEGNPPYFFNGPECIEGVGQFPFSHTLQTNLVQAGIYWSMIIVFSLVRNTTSGFLPPSTIPTHLMGPSHGSLVQLQPAGIKTNK